MHFVTKNLPDKFFLEEDLSRISLLGVLAREMAANVLIHREYGSGHSARLIIARDQMMTENANRSPSNLKLTEQTRPEQKNPVIAAFFRTIGYAEQLGSGVRNIFRYAPLYAGRMPEFIDGDMFRLVIPLDDDFQMNGAVRTKLESPMHGYGRVPGESAIPCKDTSEKIATDLQPDQVCLPQPGQEVTRNEGQSPKKDSGVTQNKLYLLEADASMDPTFTDQELHTGNTACDQILRCLASDLFATQAHLAMQLDMTKHQVKYYIGILRAHGWLLRKGSRRSGKWEIREGLPVPHR